MPRPKINVDSTTFPIAEIANLKIYTTDSIHDYKIIYRELLSYLHDSVTVSGYEELLVKCDKFTSLPDYPIEHKTRVYIVAAIDKTMLFLIDIEDCIIDNLVAILPLQIPEDKALIYDANYLFPKIFVFREKDLIYKSLIFPHCHAEFMAVFAKENKVSFDGARHDYCTKPRISSHCNKDI